MLHASFKKLWSYVLPLLAAAVLLAIFIDGLDSRLLALAIASLISAVVAAVHHAEVIAHRVGEPFGSLVLALAITVIEVSLILSLMYTSSSTNTSLLRDTIFSTVMITANGALGLCLLLGGLRHRVQAFQLEGANIGLSTLTAMATLTLVLPSFTISSSGPTYTPSQLVFAATAALLLWIMFVFMQTIRHREYFLPVTRGSHQRRGGSVGSMWISLVFLLITLVTVVGLAESMAHNVEEIITLIKAPKSVVGILVATIVLLPETTAAARAAWANRLQTSLNLAFGSAIASIGLTVPVVSVSSLRLKLPLALGLEPKSLVLLVLTVVIASITLVSGRTHIMHGVVHLVIFAAFVFLAFVP